MSEIKAAEDNGPKLLEPGDMFGDYTVEKLLGQGGMGAVYLVRAPGGERYAVKLMFPDMVKKGSDYRKRFAREAEFAMNIRHKNLISVYDVGEDPETGLCYIIMDYVPGGSVADRLEQGGPLPMAEAVSIAAQVALALEVAHRHGVIHRDIKPENIMFDADGTPKLADLGVAKFTDEAHKTTVTTTGMIIGTPAYMAPEQMMDSHHVDARADIYALGVVLYEMLTGKRPNEGSTAVELLAKAIKGEPLPDVRTMRPEVSVAIAHVLSLMCAPKPDARPATALEAAHLLQKAATGRLTLPKKPPRAADAAARKRKLRFPFTAIAIVAGIAALCAVTAVSLLNKPTQRPHPAQAVTVVTNVIDRTMVVTNVVFRGGAQTEKAVHYSGDKPRTWGKADAPGRSAFEMRSRHHGAKPAPGWIVTEPNSNGLFAVSITAQSTTTGDGHVDDRVLCAYYPQTNRYQDIRWCQNVPQTMIEEMPETTDRYIRVADKGRHLEDIDVSCRFVVRCNSVKIDFTKIDGTIPYDRTTFAYRTYTRDWRTADPGCRRISLDNPWIVAKRDEILAAVGEDHIDFAHRAYTLVAHEFALSRGRADISDVIEKKRGDEVALASVFVSLLRSAGIPARTLYGKYTNWQSVWCPEFYLEGCGWIPAGILKDVGQVDADRHFGVYDETCAIVSSDIDITLKAARDGDCHLEYPWPVSWWFYHGAWTPLDTRINWHAEPITEKDAVEMLGKNPRRQSGHAQKRGAGNAKTVEVFRRLDRSPTAWAYSFEKENNWKEANFNDSGWKRAQGGFGWREDYRQLWRARLNTTWQTEKLFVRRRFNWAGGDVSRVVVDLYHDDDVTFYLNGRLMLTVNGANFNWQPFEIPAKRFAWALKNGENVFSAEVRNYGHCQYFDCGLVVECGGNKVPHAGPDEVRTVKTPAGTWTVKVVDGIAQIGDGENVALDPPPKGTLKIPAELDGLPIQKLARDCFIRCGELESVAIPDGVRSVGEGAFFDCHRLSHVSVPSTLEHIGQMAMRGTSLRKIDVANIRLIENGAFMFCDNLENVSVNPGNLTYRVKDGILYDKVRRAIAFCPRSRKRVVIPSGIEEIYSCAFQRSKLKDVVIPETVSIVGHDAFNECPFLESVKFMGDDAIISGGAFANTPSLKTVVLPRRLKALDDWAIFNHAGQLESIVLPDTVEVIDDAVFENCPKLKRISLGKSLQKVDHHAFSSCPMLQEVSFPATLKEMGAEVFLGCTSLKSVRFAGNAPVLQNLGTDCFGYDLYKNANPSLTTLVPKGSTGWLDDSDKLPKVWPVDGGESARTIRPIK